MIETVALADVVAELRHAAGEHERQADHNRRLATIYAELAKEHDRIVDLEEAQSLQDTLRARLLVALAGDAEEL